jgi:hypothetical protein
MRRRPPRSIIKLSPIPQQTTNGDEQSVKARVREKTRRGSKPAHSLPTKRPHANMMGRGALGFTPFIRDFGTHSETHVVNTSGGGAGGVTCLAAPPG